MSYSNRDKDLLADQMIRRREIFETALLGPYIYHWYDNISPVIERNECYDMIKAFFSY